MSGISGVYLKEAVIPDRLSVLKMLDINSSRGKDYVQIHVEPHIGLGFTALNLTPESKAEQQPFSHEGITVVADVRLDRRERLINKLNKLGVRASISESDVSFIWKSYKAWGIEFPKHIVGEFSFVIWDSKLNRLFCGRDYLGFRPFFYKFNGAQFEFSSMLEGLLKTKNNPVKWNRDYFVEYIRDQGFVRSEKTPYKGIFRLPAAHTLIFQGDKLSVSKYWDIDEVKDIKYTNHGDYIEEFRHLFFESVRDCMRSNSPVSVSMSGGLDSTSIFSSGCILNQSVAVDNFFPVSLVFDKYPADDEREYIRLINEKYQIPSREVVADNLWSFKNFPKDSPITAEPSVNASTFCVQESVYLKAKEHGAKVVLTGAGGDEVLSGSNLVIADYIWNLKWGRAMKNVKKLSHVRDEPFFTNLLKYGVNPLLGGTNTNTSTWLAKDIQQAIIDKRIRRGKLARDKQESQIITNITPYIDQYIAAPMGMEARHPFLDKELVEFLIAIPMEQKVEGSIKKLILKNAMQDILPEPIRNRIDKTAHYSVIYSGLQKEWSEMTRAYDKGYLADLGILDHEDFKKDINRWRQGDTRDIDHLWTVATLELWFYRLDK
ncbi:asparagine synthase-related protein [Bacillus sp. FSL W7-1360]